MSEHCTKEQLQVNERERTKTGQLLRPDKPPDCTFEMGSASKRVMRKPFWRSDSPGRPFKVPGWDFLHLVLASLLVWCVSTCCLCTWVLKQTFTFTCCEIIEGEIPDSVKKNWKENLLIPGRLHLGAGRGGWFARGEEVHHQLEWAAMTFHLFIVERGGILLFWYSYFLWVCCWLANPYWLLFKNLKVPNPVLW